MFTDAYCSKLRSKHFVAYGGMASINNSDSEAPLLYFNAFRYQDLSILPLSQVENHMHRYPSVGRLAFCSVSCNVAVCLCCMCSGCCICLHK